MGFPVRRGAGSLRGQELGSVDRSCDSNSSIGFQATCWISQEGDLGFSTVCLTCRGPL